MNHFMLPLWNGEGLASPKYGNIANEKLLEKMLSLGSKQANLRAKIFGGGEVIESSIQQFKIGERNAALIMEFIEEYRIQVLGKSLGGKLGRKIIFNSQTGEVLHKFIEKTM
jgi:chemotaxis protein CheD